MTIQDQTIDKPITAREDATGYGILLMMLVVFIFGATMLFTGVRRLYVEMNAPHKCPAIMPFTMPAAH